MRVKATARVINPVKKSKDGATWWQFTVGLKLDSRGWDEFDGFRYFPETRTLLLPAYRVGKGWVRSARLTPETLEEVRRSLEEQLGEPVIFAPNAALTECETSKEKDEEMTEHKCEVCGGAVSKRMYQEYRPYRVVICGSQACCDVINERRK